MGYLDLLYPCFLTISIVLVIAIHGPINSNTNDLLSLIACGIFCLDAWVVQYVCMR